MLAADGCSGFAARRLLRSKRCHPKANGEICERDWRTAGDVRSTLHRRGTEKFARLPRPVQQGCRLIGRTRRATLADRVPGLAAEAALFTLISLPALLLAVIGSLGFVAAALGPEGTDQLRELVLGIPRRRRGHDAAGLRAYLALSVQADAVFSQLAVPIAVVLWLYITAFAVLLGAEFNGEIERMWPHEDHPWRLPRLAVSGRNLKR